MTEVTSLGQTLFQGLLTWLSYGLLHASWLKIVAYTLAVTHITIASVTIYLHRSQAHRAVDLHPIVSHFFRFWLWVSTGMNTIEWVAIHRKHHAKCETVDDPHSPQIYGLKKLILEGAELYRAEAKNLETIAKYRHGTPDDWIERNIYTRFGWQGVGLMLIVNVLLFGAVGASVWAVQMMWIPLMATAIINGIGHYWGYRNFEAPDASTNVSPWGILIGGEELHNNHHTYPTSAKLSVKPYEFDLGWAYIRTLQFLGLATVRKTPPKLSLGEIQPVADAKTLEAIIANRYELMANYARELRQACGAELAHMKADGQENTPRWIQLNRVKAWLHREDNKIPDAIKPRLAEALAHHPKLSKLVSMREELQQLWLRSNVSAERLVADLQTWCKCAEDSGILALQEFSLKLRSVRT